MKNQISAVNLTVGGKKLKKLEQKSEEYKEGFFAGFVACKSRATAEGYHKDIKQE